MNAGISVVCYKSKTLKNGESPLMLRICKDGKKKYQSLGISVNPKHWNFKKNEPKPKFPNFERIQKIILDKKVEVQKKMLEMRADQKEYTATTLIIKEDRKHLSSTVCDFYKEIIAKCEAENKCGNRLVYLNSYNSLMTFTKNRLDIPFNIIDVAWLERYEKWLRARGNKETTICLMFRTLRSAYNKAIKEKVAKCSVAIYKQVIYMSNYLIIIIMNEIIMMPNLAKRINLGEYAEEAVIVEDTIIRTPNNLHFIEANTSEVDLQHLRKDCITPVFAKDNELTINHASFIETIQEATKDFFNGEVVDDANIRVSHIIKGRIPEALHKPANQLLESDKTLYYERCAFSIDVPTIWQDVNGNRLNLSVVGVRAYNQMNLYSKKVPELFRLAVGFKNQVCCNMCVFTDGYKEDLKVSSVTELYAAALELFNNFNPAKQIHLMQQLGGTSMSEHQFCTFLGKSRLYQCLSTNRQKHLPRLLLTDTQINSVAKAYIQDSHFGREDGELNMWKFYNLLTGANKSSYIDSFLDRSLNASEMALGINAALHGDETYKWFID